MFQFVFSKRLPEGSWEVYKPTVPSLAHGTAWHRMAPLEVGEEVGLSAGTSQGAGLAPSWRKSEDTRKLRSGDFRCAFGSWITYDYI